jgi:hypothetical protein
LYSINQWNLEIDSRKNELIEVIIKKILLLELQNEYITLNEFHKKKDILDGTFSHVKKMFS